MNTHTYKNGTWRRLRHQRERIVVRDAATSSPHLREDVERPLVQPVVAFRGTGAHDTSGYDRAEAILATVAQLREKRVGPEGYVHGWIKVGAGDTPKVKTKTDVDIDENGSVTAKHGDYEIHAAETTGWSTQQSSHRISATDKDGNEVGHLEYSRADGWDGKKEIHIDHIGVDPAHRGKGLPTAMWKVARVTHPGEAVDPGMLTDEGAKWWNGASMKNLKGRPISKPPWERAEGSAELRYDPTPLSNGFDAWFETNSAWLEAQTDLAA